MNLLFETPNVTQGENSDRFWYLMTEQCSAGPEWGHHCLCDALMVTTNEGGYSAPYRLWLVTFRQRD